MRRIGVLLAAAAWAAASAAPAQITFQPSTASFGAQMGGQLLDIQRDSLRRGGVVRRAGSAYGEGAPAAHGAQTAYRSDPAVTARVQRQFVAFVRQRSGAAGGDAMAKAFASQDLLQSWARQAAPDGLRLGDVADAMAEYWVTNWLIAHGRSESSPRATAAVRDQLRAVLARDAAFARLTGAQRQEMAEVLIYNTLLQGEVVGAALRRRDASFVARAGDAAVARFRNEAGIDLRRVELTDAGFVRKG